MVALKNYFFIIMLFTFGVSTHAMEYLRGIVANSIMNVPSVEEIENTYNRKNDEANAIYTAEINSPTYADIKKQYLKSTQQLHPDKLISTSSEDLIKILVSRGVEAKTYTNKTEEELCKLIGQEYEKEIKPYIAIEDKCNFAKKEAENERERNLLAREKLAQHAFFIDLYIVGGLTVGTGVAVAGIIKAWHLFKEYASPNTILLEKMELAANKAVTTILSLEFDRYNPTQDTDSLYMQFDIDALLAQLSSDKVRNQVKKAILDFDKALEATYEECAWHYDGMTAEELAKQNPRLVNELLVKLRTVKKAFKLCRKDLKLDRNRFLDFFKGPIKK